MTARELVETARIAVAGLLADYAAAVDARDADAVGDVLRGAVVTFKGIGPMAPNEARGFYADALTGTSDAVVTHIPGTPSLRQGRTEGEVEFAAPYLRCATPADGATSVHTGRYGGTVHIGPESVQLRTFVVTDI